MSNLQSTGELRIDDYRPSLAYLNFKNSSSHVLNLANTEIARLWKTVQINWIHPVNDMKLIIETPFTKKRWPYAILIDYERLMRTVSRVSRIIDGKEIEINMDECKYPLDCDSNYQVILKLYSTLTFANYGSIKYDVIAK